MFRFRKSGAVVAAIVIGSSAAISTSEAAAATCHISVSGLPSKVIIDGNQRVYSYKGSSSGCSSLDTDYSDASATIVGPNSTTRVQDFVYGDFNTADKYYLDSSYDWRAGTYKVIDGGSTVVNSDYDEIPYTWNVKTMSAKYDSNTTLSVTRSGSTVTYTGTVRRYSPAAYGYVNQNRYVYIEYSSGGTWRPLEVVTSPEGRYSYTYSTNYQHTYRARIAEKTDTWASVSGSVTK